MDTKPHKKQNLVIIILCLIASVLIITILVQHFSSKKNKLLVLQNEEIRKEIRDARVEINKYKGISEKLDIVVKNANNKINEQEEKIIKLISKSADLKKENNEFKNEIRDIKKDYLEVIDSLLVEKGTNSILNSKIEELENEIETLSGKVGLAKLFIIENIVAVPIKESIYGNRRQTAMAKKTSILRVCFDILENKVIAPGFHDIYLRVISPDAIILKENDESTNTFLHPVYKKNVEYSMREIINYKNEKINMCIKLPSARTLKPGLYMVELFTENQKLGTTTFTLK